MNLTDNETLKFLKGSPVFIGDICAVYPATLGEIVDIGYDNFQQYLGILTMTKPMDAKGDSEYEDLLNQITDFQYLLLMASMDLNVNTTLKSALRFFTHMEATITMEPPMIIMGPIEEKRFLDDTNFKDLQHLINRMYFIEQEGDEIIINDDDDPATKRIKMQMKANREKRRRQENLRLLLLPPPRP